MYSLVLKKGEISLEFVTSNKDIIEKHLALIINSASNCTEKNLEEKDQETVQNQEIKPVSFEPQTNDETEHPVEDTPIERINSIEEIPLIEPTQQVEEKPVENNITNESAEEISENISIPATTALPYKPNTINSIQNPEPVVQEEPDFDKILTNEMGQETKDVVLKDSKFIEFVESKSAIEKIDFLVITAQYMAQYENLNTFNLKHINAKLMQNFTIIVDHAVLQSAISKEYITKIVDKLEDGSGEYMLTEKGLRSY